MTFLWIPPLFDEDSVLPTSVVALLWAFKRFRKEVILEKVVVLRLLLRFFQFCDQWIWSVGAAELVSWSYAGMKVNSFDGKMVCLSSMKKDLPRIKTIGCLKYGSWMIRHVPMFEARACLLLELSPRSCLKFKTYGFRYVFKFLFSDVCILLLGNVQSLFHLCSSVVFVLEQWNRVGFVYVPGSYLGLFSMWIFPF
ncbi:hypothetical protein GQ457_12G001710 [Hibiscus cannabinus]